MQYVPETKEDLNIKTTTHAPGIVNPIAFNAVPTSSVIDCVLDAKAFSKYGRCCPLYILLFPIISMGSMPFLYSEMTFSRTVVWLTIERIGSVLFPGTSTRLARVELPM